MADCELLGSCLFLNDKMKDLPDHADLFKGLYCRGNHNLCARFMVYTSRGREAVPSDLFPNEIQRANMLIEQSREK